MKKLFIRVADWIRNKINNFAIKRFISLMPKTIITELYRKVVERDLQITTKTIFVKKGHLRYTLIVVKDKNLQTIFNLGRHGSNQPVISNR